MKPGQRRLLFPLLLAGLFAVPFPGEPQTRMKFLPDFEATTLAGERLTAQGLRGKVVLLDFWATWCAPCVQSLPSLRELSQQLEGEPFFLLSISADRAAGPVRKFVKKNQMTWPQVWDKGNVLRTKLKVSSFPTYMLVNGEGEILYTTTGWGEGSERVLAAKINQALKELKTRPAATDVAAQ